MEMKLTKEISTLLRGNKYYCALDAIEELLELENSIKVYETKDFEEMTGLLLASEVNEYYIDLLKSKNFDFTKKYDNGSLLHLFIKFNGNNIKTFLKLIDIGLCISEVDSNGNNILHLLCSEKLVMLNKELKQIDIALNFISKDNIEDLFIKNNKNELPIKILLNNFIDGKLQLNTKLIYHMLDLVTNCNIYIDDEEWFEIMVDASNSGNIEVFNYIYNICKDKNLISNTGQSITHYLVVNNLKPTIRNSKVILENKIIMINNVSDINIIDDNGMNPLLYGLSKVTGTSINFWDVLIEKGIDVNIVDNNGNNALLLAVNNINTIKSLINNNCNINHKNKEGITPLMLAVINNKFDVVEELVLNKSDLDIVDNKGRNALSIAIEKGNEKIINVLMGN